MESVSVSMDVAVGTVSAWMQQLFTLIKTVFFSLYFRSVLIISELQVLRKNKPSILSEVFYHLSFILLFQRLSSVHV